MTMTEVLLGPKSATELTNGLNAGKLALEAEVVIDAASVYDAIAAADVKCPSDVSMHIHIVKMKELLCNKQTMQSVEMGRHEMHVSRRAE